MTGGPEAKRLLRRQLRRWRRRLGPISPAAVAVVFLAVCAALLSMYALRKADDVPAAYPTSKISAPVASSVAPAVAAPALRMPTSAIGNPIRDKDIEFLVGSIKPLGGTPASPKAFQVVSVTMTNTGVSPWQVDVSGQRLVDDQGHDYPADIALSGQLSNGIAMVLKPGAAGTMNIAFAAPTGVKPATVVLRAGPQTPGVAVTLK
jgi:Domain of unknown function (DUF4352)